MHLSDQLTFGQIRYQAGWISAKLYVAISLTVSGLLALLLIFAKIAKPTGYIVIVGYIILLILIVISVWYFGSKNPKYQLLMLREFIHDQKKNIERYKKSNATKYKIDIKWHEKKLAIARDFLVKISFGSTWPRNFSEAIEFTIKNVHDASRGNYGYIFFDGEKNWTTKEILYELENRTIFGEYYVDYFLAGIDSLAVSNKT